VCYGDNDDDDDHNNNNKNYVIENEREAVSCFLLCEEWKYVSKRIDAQLIESYLWAVTHYIAHVDHRFRFLYDPRTFLTRAQHHTLCESGMSCAHKWVFASGELRCTNFANRNDRFCVRISDDDYVWKHAWYNQMALLYDTRLTVVSKESQKTVEMEACTAHHVVGFSLIVLFSEREIHTYNMETLVHKSLRVEGKKELISKNRIKVEEHIFLSVFTLDASY